MGKPNAYSLFVKQEFRQRQQRGENVSFGRLFKDLDAKWRSLPEEVKQKFKDRAKGDVSIPQNVLNQFNESTGSIVDSDTSKLLTDEIPALTGPDYTDIKPNVEIKPLVKIERGVKREFEHDDGDNPQESEEQVRKRTKLGFAVPNWKNIRNSSQPDAERYFDYYLVEIRNNCESIIRTRERRLMTMPIYTFSCNVLCKHKRDDKEIFVPLEFGIHSYSLQKGRVRDPYSVIIDAGAPPIGCYNAAKDHQDSHKITFGPGAYPSEARNDYRAIYKEMLSYTKDGERTILITDVKDSAQVRGSLEWLYEKASMLDKSLPKASTWTILPLIEYVVSMYNFVYQRMLHSPKPKFVLHYFVKMLLESSLMDYNESLMCSYHEKESNQTKWCAKSCATRAIMYIEPTLEEIFKMYKTATRSPPEKNAGSQRPAPPHGYQIVPGAPPMYPTPTSSATAAPPSQLQQHGPAVMPAGSVACLGPQQQKSLPVEESGPVLAIEAPNPVPAPATSRADPRLRRQQEEQHQNV